MRKKSIIHIEPGQQFGRWKVIDHSTKHLHGHRYFECQCECGTTRPVLASSLITGKSVSCGCYKQEAGTKHGHSTRSRTSPEYTSWRAMMTRW